MIPRASIPSAAPTSPTSSVSEKYPDARIFKLETNYRSTPEILNLANRSIRNNEEQFHKVLRAVKRSGNRPQLVTVLNTAQQANFVAQRVVDCVLDGVPLHEIAVLYRAHFHSMEIQMELTRRRIPHEVRSGIRFSSRRTSRTSRPTCGYS